MLLNMFLEFLLILFATSNGLLYLSTRNPMDCKISTIVDDRKMRCQSSGFCSED